MGLLFLTLTNYTLDPLGLQLFTSHPLLSSVASVLGQLVDVGAPFGKPDHSIGSLSREATLAKQCEISTLRYFRASMRGREKSVP